MTVGPSPLYNPLMPSSNLILLIVPTEIISCLMRCLAYQILHLVPIVPLYLRLPMPWFCNLVFTTSRGQVTTDDITPAPAPAMECFSVS